MGTKEQRNDNENYFYGTQIAIDGGNTLNESVITLKKIINYWLEHPASMFSGFSLCQCCHNTSVKYHDKRQLNSLKRKI